MTTQQLPTSGPYGVAYVKYWDAGWRGVIPLPERAKAHPPTGWTGRTGGWPSRADVTAWAEGHEGIGNLGLRLPRNIIGLDVDNYAAKAGARTLADAVDRWGGLPATWRSTSRDDGISGIALYVIPEGLAWPSVLGPGTEIIQYGHRYVVAWPSIHPEGRMYRWITPDGATAVTTVPDPDQLPELPASWVAGLTGGRLETDVAKADLDNAEAVAWLVTYGAGEVCGLMAGEVDRYIATRFTDHESRHDAARDATARLTHLAADGHRGAYTAIEDIRGAFMAATEADGLRPRDPGEWKRLLLGAIAIAAVDTQGAARGNDPCDVTVLEHDDDEVGAVPPVTVLDDPTAPVPPDTSILDDTPTEQALKAAHQRAVEAETNFQRIRRDAKRILDTEDIVKAFREPPCTFTLVEELLIPEEPVTYTVDAVMPTGANVLLTAQYKAGKTTLVNHLARCIADSEPFLGRFTVTPPDGRIALFNYEVDERQYRRWLRELGIQATPLVSVLNLRGYRLPLTSGHVEDWIVSWLAARDAAVWIVDPFARAFTGSGTSENDNTEVGRFLDTLDVIKTRAGVSDLILPTHTGREQFEEGHERARGATRLDDWADVRWMLNKTDDDTRFFSATGRDVDVEECTLNYDERTRRLSVTGGGSRAKESNRKLHDAVISVIAVNPGIGTNKLRRAVRQVVGKITNTAVDDAVGDAEDDHLVRVEVGPNRANMHYLAGPTSIVEEDE